MHQVDRDLARKRHSRVVGMAGKEEAGDVCFAHEPCR
jgi:hypothetical protein